MKKSHRGAQLIRLLSIPRADGTFNNDPTLMAEMIDYCEQDVRAMRSISKALRPLSEDELLDYHINERINDRGVLVDVPLCKAAIKYASDELVEIQDIVAEVTEGEITSVRSPKMRQWVIDRVGPQALKLMETKEKTLVEGVREIPLYEIEKWTPICGSVDDGRVIYRSDSKKTDGMFQERMETAMKMVQLGM